MSGMSGEDSTSKRSKDKVSKEGQGLKNRRMKIRDNELAKVTSHGKFRVGLGWGWKLEAHAQTPFLSRSNLVSDIPCIYSPIN